MRLPRSYLYVPGDQPDKLAKALRSGADAVIADLEDGVAPSRKALARDTVVEWLVAGVSGPQVWVRINDEEDAAAIAPARPDGLYVPKVSSVADIERVDIGLPMTALIETAAGVLDARAIAGHPSVVRLALGEADLGAELAIDASPDDREWLSVRSMIVLASSAAAIASPTGPVSTDFKNLDAFRTSSVALKRLGFGARAAIHPAQVSVVNETFTPAESEVAAARRLIERFEAAGQGVTTGEDGTMIDEAIIRSARRVLAQAEDSPS